MIILGFHAIEETIRSTATKGELYVAGKGGRVGRLIETARTLGVRVHYVDSRELDRLSEGKEHRGAVLAAPDVDVPTFLELGPALDSIKSSSPLVVLLDQITDPHNLGAILRSADLFSVDLVILPSRRSAHVNQTVSKTSAGASNYVRLTAVPNFQRAVEELKNRGYWVYGAAMGGEPITSVDLKGSVALVLGSEGEGLKRLVSESCDTLVRIPTAGHIDSLNVSVAAGICMYEIRRQQDFGY